MTGKKVCRPMPGKPVHSSEELNLKKEKIRKREDAIFRGNKILGDELIVTTTINL
jgi:hypothetical protein